MLIKGLFENIEKICVKDIEKTCIKDLEKCTIKGNEIRHFGFLLIYRQISTIRLRNVRDKKRVRLCK